MNLYDEHYDDGYYHIGKDIEAYPDAGIYVIYSGRGYSKTYSSLWYVLRHKAPFAYIRRTKADVDKMCASKDSGFDLSPFVAINRDMKTSYRPKPIFSGMAGVWEDDGSEDWDKGDPIGFIFSLNNLKEFKGADTLFDLEYMIMDEFVPGSAEVQISQQEGRRLLDTYMTFCRDRKRRGKPTPKLILLSNTARIDCPIIDTLEIGSQMLKLTGSEDPTYYDEKRKIFFHHIRPAEFPEIKKSMADLEVAEAMQGTAWYDENIEGQFMVDMSNIRKVNLKGYRCECMITYNRHPFFLYYNPSQNAYYACDIPHQCNKFFDFDKDADKRRWSLWDGFKINRALARNAFKASDWTYYDVLVRFNTRVKM